MTKIVDRSELSTSSRSSMGVFCGDDVVVGLKIVFVEFVDEVRLPSHQTSRPVLGTE